jgi:hypothetical protein
MPISAGEIPMLDVICLRKTIPNFLGGSLNLNGNFNHV